MSLPYWSVERSSPSLHAVSDSPTRATTNMANILLIFFISIQIISLFVWNHTDVVNLDDWVTVYTGRQYACIFVCTLDNKDIEGAEVVHA